MLSNGLIALYVCAAAVAVVMFIGCMVSIIQTCCKKSNSNARMVMKGQKDKSLIVFNPYMYDTDKENDVVPIQIESV